MKVSQTLQLMLLHCLAFWKNKFNKTLNIEGSFIHCQELLENMFIQSCQKKFFFPLKTKRCVIHFVWDKTFFAQLFLTLSYGRFFREWKHILQLYSSRKKVLAFSYFFYQNMENHLAEKLILWEIVFIPNSWW